MGWAIQRPDGTYRSWYANGQDESLRPGEVYVASSTSPAIGPAVAEQGIPTSQQALKTAIQTALAQPPVTPVELQAILQAWLATLP